MEPVLYCGRYDRMKGMDIFVLVLLAGLGMIFGSFANALVWRLHSQEEVRQEINRMRLKLKSTKHKTTRKPAKPTKAQVSKDFARVRALEARLQALSMSKGRSMCSKCRHPLAPNDLIPLISWILLRGKCRYCHQPIQDTPLLEIGLPIVFVISFVFWPLGIDRANLVGYGSVAFVLWLAFMVGFAVLTAYDIRWFLLPDKIVWPLVALALLQVVLHATVFNGGTRVIYAALWGVLICSGFFYVLFTLSKGQWIGGGDVKLGIVLGLLAGGPLPGLLVLFAASLLGTAVSLPMLIQKKLQRTSIIPFGPFLMFGCVIVVLFGQRLTDWFSALVSLPV